MLAKCMRSRFIILFVMKNILKKISIIFGCLGLVSVFSIPLIFSLDSDHTIQTNAVNDNDFIFDESNISGTTFYETTYWLDSFTTTGFLHNGRVLTGFTFELYHYSSYADYGYDSIVVKVIPRVIFDNDDIEYFYNTNYLYYLFRAEDFSFSIAQDTFTKFDFEPISFFSTLSYSTSASQYRLMPSATLRPIMYYEYLDSSGYFFSGLMEFYWFCSCTEGYFLPLFRGVPYSSSVELYDNAYLLPYDSMCKLLGGNFTFSGGDSYISYNNSALNDSKQNIDGRWLPGRFTATLGNRSILEDSLSELPYIQQILEDKNAQIIDLQNQLGSVSAIGDTFDLISLSFSGFLPLLDLEIAPNITIGMILTIPFVVAIIGFAIKLIS